MVTVRVLVLFSLLTTAFGDLSLFRGIGPLQSEKIFDFCLSWADGKNPRIMALNQHWEHPTPSEIITLQMEKPNSKIFQSVFEVRTLDPEGVIFYGDAEGGENWFVLALRDGRPEIQISNEYCSLVVSSGIVLNDGKWKKIMVRNQKNDIKLVVNDETVLVITILPSVGLDENLIDMRIAIGGLLMNESNLLIPLRIPLDACITSWNWLEQNTSWLMEKVARNPNIQCPTNIVPGSFFPGIGIAVFRTSDVVNEAEPQAGGWALSFEATIRPIKHTGLIMALLTAQYDPMVKLQFSLQDHHEHFSLDLGDSTVINMAGPERLCDGKRVTLSVSETEVRLQIGDQVASRPVKAKDFAALRTSWVSHQPVLFLGGLPDVEKLGYSWYLYSGCMQDIRLQGEAVDFNLAWYKHDAITSHSCPAPDPSQSTLTEFH